MKKKLPNSLTVGNFSDGLKTIMTSLKNEKEDIILTWEELFELLPDAKNIEWEEIVSQQTLNELKKPSK